MELDNLALESVMDARRKAVQTSIRQISTEELNSLVTEILFEDPAHPWCEIFRQFIKDNASAVFYQAFDHGTHTARLLSSEGVRHLTVPGVVPRAAEAVDVVWINAQAAAKVKQPPGDHL
jgi:hypothetical protein